MRSILVNLFLHTFTVYSFAVLPIGPTPTDKTENEISEQGWTPKPTNQPLLEPLVKRDYLTVCGYINGDSGQLFQHHILDCT